MFKSGLVHGLLCSFFLIYFFVFSDNPINLRDFFLQISWIKEEQKEKN